MKEFLSLSLIKEVFERRRLMAVRDGRRNTRCKTVEVINRAEWLMGDMNFWEERQNLRKNWWLSLCVRERQSEWMAKSKKLAHI